MMNIENMDLNQKMYFLYVLIIVQLVKTLLNIFSAC